MFMIKIFEEYSFYDEINEIDYSKFDINNVDDSNMFDYIYSYSPDTIKGYIDSLKNIEQRKDYHPEGNVYEHTKTVVNRLAKTKNINLILSGYLHDTGKDRTTEIKDDTIMQPGHEVYSAQLLNIGSPWRMWIRELRGDPDIVKFIIRNHMRMKAMKGDIRNKRWFDSLDERIKYYMVTFSNADRGGWFKNIK